MLGYLYDYQNKMVESDWFHFLVGNVPLPDKTDLSQQHDEIYFVVGITVDVHLKNS